MYTKNLLLLLFTGLLFHSCTNDAIVMDDKAGTSSEIFASLNVRGATGFFSETDENRINTVSIFSFVQKPGEAAYTYEKTFSQLLPSWKDEKAELSFTLNGSLSRILYFIANDATKVSFLAGLKPGVPSILIDEQLLLVDRSIPEAPFTMVSKVLVNDPSQVSQLAVEFTHTLSRLDIVNKYVGFTVDSMIVRNAILGTYAFNDRAVWQLPRADQKYMASPIYLYAASDVTLSIYGKYNGIRAVFDMNLKEIKKATRYNVIFRSINDHELNFTNNLAWEVTPWTKGEVIESTPDWK